MRRSRPRIAWMRGDVLHWLIDPLTVCSTCAGRLPFDMKANSPAPAPQRQRPPRGPALGLEIAPTERRSPSLTSWDGLLQAWRSGRFGMSISVMIHGVVLTVLGVLIFDNADRHRTDAIEVRWLDEHVSLPGAKGPRKPFTLPLTIPPSSTPGETSSGPSPPSEQTASAVTESSSPAGIHPVGVAGALGNRGMGSGGGGGGGAGSIEQLGGSSEAQRAVRAGLAWLARQQTREGKWELHQGYPDAAFKVIRTDTGATALALLALLGAGHTPDSGEHAAVAAKGVRWLIDTQDPLTGDLHDQRQEEGRQPAFYAHAMATMVLCEALALTKNERLRPPAEKAVQYLLDSQHPEFGGWKYRPISKLMVGDLSVTGWALMALHTARMAGIDVPASEFERASAFLNTVQEQGGSRYKYEPLDPPDRVSVALTAEGLLCRQWLGMPKASPAQRDGVAFLLAEENHPRWAPGRRNVYAWYYTAQTLHNLGGVEWKEWYAPLRDLVIKHQVTAGSSRAPNDVRGSWHPTQPPGAGEEYGEKAGRLYVTVMCLLILETPYRHMPLYAE